MILTFASPLQEHIDPGLLSNMWKDTIGKSPSKGVVTSTMESYGRTSSDGSYLTYEECQNALLQELQELGLVPILSRTYVLAMSCFLMFLSKV